MNLKPQLQLGERSFIEKWLDKHNAMMAFLRTILGTINVFIAIAICLKVYSIV